MLGASSHRELLTAEIGWFLHTPAPVRVDEWGAGATLIQGDRRLWARTLMPGLSFRVMEAQPLPSSSQPEKQAQNGGVCKLAIHRTGITDLHLAVLLAPLWAGESAPTALPGVSLLAKWQHGTDPRQARAEPGLVGLLWPDSYESAALTYRNWNKTSAGP
jgi:hypothetical protein